MINQKKVYIAGPLFNSLERNYLEQVANALEAQGFDTFLPHRDAGLLLNIDNIQERSSIFLQDIQALKNCDILIALLTGADHDSGTSAELGYAIAQGKICFGLSDDSRRVNNFIWGLCGEGKLIVQSIEELLQLLKSLHLC